MALFCNLNTSSLLAEFPQKIMPYVIIEWIYEKYLDSCVVLARIID
jgi:hypothetical protein